MAKWHRGFQKYTKFSSMRSIHQTEIQVVLSKKKKKGKKQKKMEKKAIYKDVLKI